MRALSIATMLLLITTPTLAASPKAESAVKVLEAVGADANKLKAFCELMSLDGKLEDKEDPVLEGQIDKLLDQLGADFKDAWDTIEDTDEHSPDGRALSAAMDQLEAKCPPRRTGDWLHEDRERHLAAPSSGSSHAAGES